MIKFYSESNTCIANSECILQLLYYLTDSEISFCVSAPCMVYFIMQLVGLQVKRGNWP